MTSFACDQTLCSNFQGKDQIGSAKYLKKKIPKEIAIFFRIFYSLFDELFNYEFITVKIFKTDLILRNLSKRYFRSIGTESFFFFLLSISQESYFKKFRNLRGR